MISKFLNIGSVIGDDEERQESAHWKKIRLFLSNIRVQLAAVATYRMGYDFVKGMLLPPPKINPSELHSEEVCVMTGATRGIGFEILKLLLKLDYTVVVGVRNIEKMENEIQKIRESGISTGHTEILHLDLKSLQSVRAFSEEVLSQTSRIDLLINNAGMNQKHYEVTEDNIECLFQVNYLSHFLLTNLLLPRIKLTAKGKVDYSLSCHIINTTSRLQFIGSLDFNNLATTRKYEHIKAYCDSKLCQVLHTKSVQSQLEKEGVTNVYMYAIHPGDIPTELWHGVSMFEEMTRPLLKLLCQSKEDAASTVLHPALSPDLAGACGGKYFEWGRSVKPNWQAEDEKMREQLWQMSVKLTTNQLQQ